MTDTNNMSASDETLEGRLRNIGNEFEPDSFYGKLFYDSLDEIAALRDRCAKLETALAESCDEARLNRFESAGGPCPIAGGLQRELDQARARISALEDLAKQWEEFVGKIQSACVEYLVPDGRDADWLIDRILWLVDGPEYRAIIDAALASENTT